MLTQPRTMCARYCFKYFILTHLIFTIIYKVDRSFLARPVVHRQCPWPAVEHWLITTIQAPWSWDLRQEPENLEASFYLYLAAWLRASQVTSLVTASTFAREGQTCSWVTSGESNIAATAGLEASPPPPASSRGLIWYNPQVSWHAHENQGKAPDNRTDVPSAWTRLGGEGWGPGLASGMKTSGETGWARLPLAAVAAVSQARASARAPGVMWGPRHWGAHTATPGWHGAQDQNGLQGPSARG